MSDLQNMNSRLQILEEENKKMKALVKSLDGLFINDDQQIFICDMCKQGLGV